MNRKGLASGLLAVIIVLFVFAMFSLVALTGWNMVDDTFQDMGDDVVSPSVKEKITGLGVFMGWGDKVFTLFFIALLVGYMVTSLTISTDRTIFILLYFFMLVLITIVAMVLSNGWAYLVANPNLAAAAADMPFTNWFFAYLPIITFFMGLIGGIIFYARKKSAPTGNGFNVDFDDVSGGGGL